VCCTVPIGIFFALCTLRLADAEQFETVFEASDPALFVLTLAACAGLSATLWILQYVTPGFADRLIAALKLDIQDALINNTIDSEAPNIRQLPLNRRFFAHLERQFSPKHGGG
jgi:hypothetical protein